MDQFSAKRLRLESTQSSDDMTAVADSMRSMDLVILVPSAKDSGDNVVAPINPGWPAQKVPTELFGLITAYLNRRAVQNMRLVNKEFNSKVSRLYFRNVVMNFNPDLLDGPEKNAEDAWRKATTFSITRGIQQGTRVFDDFGDCIRAFAFALELNMADFLSPPLKVDQEIIKTSWGLYRWPLEEYARFLNLKNIEILGDETMRIKQALGKLENLAEFGISCDAGLGFFAGNKPQIQPQLPVFKSSGGMNLPVRIIQGHSSGVFEKSPRYAQLRHMLLAAGFEPTEMMDAVKLLLECENTTGERRSLVARVFNDDGLPETELGREIAHLAIPFRPNRSSEPLPLEGRNSARDPSPDLLINATFSHNDTSAPDAQEENFAWAMIDEIIRTAPTRQHGLTQAQVEMLLEMKWAHEAFLQTIRIAVVDVTEIFSNLTSFTIARIPSSYLPAFDSSQFWDGLPSLRKLSLAVIADWRQIKRVANGALKSPYVCPTQSYAPVFQFIQNRISVLEQLESFHFEWICGGELAQGKGQRNRHLLPAPFAATPELLHPAHAAGQGGDLLSLPFIKKLSLKNCWVTPHVLMHVVSAMIDSKLIDLSLESVSLTGKPIVSDNWPDDRMIHHNNHWPWPLCLQSVVEMVMAPIHAAMGHAGHAPFGAFGQPNPIGGAYQPWVPDANVLIPRLFAWSHVLNYLSPAKTMEDQFETRTCYQDEYKYQGLVRAARAWIGRGPHRKKLQSLRLKQCGYALVDVANLDSQFLIPLSLEAAGGRGAARRLYDLHKELRALDAELDGTLHVAACGGSDLLGKVADVVDAEERDVLAGEFGVRFGCFAELYGAQEERRMRDDGFAAWGGGRFSGGWEEGRQLDVEDMFPRPDEPDESVPPARP